LPYLGCACVEVVAVEAWEAADAGLGRQVVECAVGAAVGIGEDSARSLGPGSQQHPFGVTLYLFRSVVEGGRQRADGDRPASAGGDLPDMASQGAAGDDLDGLRS
jgi:hypothetical protein